MNYRLRIKLTRRDVLRAIIIFQWAALKRNPFTYIIFTVLMASFIYLANTGYQSAAVFIMFVVLMVATIFYLIPAFQADKQVKNNPGLFREMAVRFSTEFFMIKPGEREIRLRWEDVAGWQFGKQVLLIYQTSSNFHIVPVSGFKDRRQFDNVLELLSDKVGPAGKIRRVNKQEPASE